MFDATIRIIMHSPAQEVKERLSILDVVSSYVKLDKAGAHYKARCPFHSEKTASFVVSPVRGTYHCFGCNKGGDIFSFVEEIEGIDFREALEKLAAQAGVVLRVVDPKEASARKAEFDCIEQAAKFYEYMLGKNAAALEYLVSRGISPESIKAWRIGYAPADWRQLTTFLVSRKHAEHAIEKVGLGITGERGMYDRFRGRIMFPIFDSQGRVVAFSGRLFDPSGTQPDAAKYVNSPETSLYNKSKILYGYDRAKQGMLREGSAVLVEGQVDLVMAHQAGTINAVAVSGTALTEEHLGLIKRFTDNLLIAFDSDKAGLAAGERGVRMALALGMDVKMVRITSGKDPADLIKDDPGAWRRALAEAKHVILFYLDALGDTDGDPRTLIKEVAKRVLPFVVEVKNTIDQDYFIKQIAHRLGVGEDAVRAEAAKIRDTAPEIKSADMTLFTVTETTTLERRIAGIYLWRKSLTNTAHVGPHIEAEYERITGRPLASLIESIPENHKQELILRAEVEYAGHREIRNEIDELLLSLEDEVLRDRLGTLLAIVKRRGEDLSEAELSEIHTIQKQRDDLRTKRVSETL